MLIAKYEKTGVSKYIPHLDTLRHIQRTVKRAGIETAYSAGFNPHMLMFMSSPIPLGQASLCEYFTVDTVCDKDVFAAKFNSVSPAGLKITGIAFSSRDPKLGGIITQADYSVYAESLGKYQEAVLKLINSEFNICYESKGKEIIKPVNDKIKSAVFSGDILHLRVSCGQNNLRPDRLMSSILKELNIDMELDIIKKKVYTGEDTGLIALDDFLMIKEIY